jgi:histone acetyltransferase (RNA polymerase elongator complex component)
MVNKQNKTLKTVKLPLKNDTYAFQYSKEIDQRPVIAETWDPEVAQFFMELYPTLLNEGNTISDLHQRASFEALSKSTSINSIDDFLQIVSKLKVKKD